MVQTLYVQDYKHICDIIDKYKLYKVKVQESSLHWYSLRDGVGLEGRAVLGSDLLPLAFKDLVNM